MLEHWNSWWFKMLFNELFVWWSPLFSVFMSTRNITLLNNIVFYFIIEDNNHHHHHFFGGRSTTILVMVILNDAGICWDGQLKQQAAPSGIPSPYLGRGWWRFVFCRYCDDDAMTPWCVSFFVDGWWQWFFPSCMIWKFDPSGELLKELPLSWKHPIDFLDSTWFNWTQNSNRHMDHLFPLRVRPAGEYQPKDTHRSLFEILSQRHHRDVCRAQDILAFTSAVSTVLSLGFASSG